MNGSVEAANAPEATSTPPGIWMRGVTYTVADGDHTRVLLDHLDLTVEAGEMVAVMGPSGSGKSTLLMIAAGLLISPGDDEAGAVHIGGHDLATAGYRMSTLRRDVIGYIEQRLNLIDVLTAAENVALPLAFTRAPKSEIRQAALAALEDVGLASMADVVVDRLSGGEQQRIAIARSLIGQRWVVIADEPTSALDRLSGDEVMAVLRRRCDAEGAAVLLATHDPSHAAWADRVLQLRDGRLIDTARVPA